MNIKAKRMICLLIVIASVLTIIGTVSYAYFSTVGEFQNQTATISTGKVSVTFKDSDIGITGKLTFGDSISKSFTIENTGTVEANVKMYWKDLINTYTEKSLTYTLSFAKNEDGPYTNIVDEANVPVSDKFIEDELATILHIPVEEKYHFNLTITLNYLPDVSQDDDLDATFSSYFEIKDVNEKIKYEVYFDAGLGTTPIEKKTLFVNDRVFGNLPMPTREGYKFLGWFTEEDGGTQILDTSIFESESNLTLYAHWAQLTNVSDKIISLSQGTKTQFDTVATTDEGVWQMPDAYGKSYYFRGAVENNYLKFGKNNSGQDMWWRIIRVNGDKTLRIQYDGVGPADSLTYTRGFAGTSVWNSSSNDAKYMGYMYGPAGTTASTSKSQAQTNTASSTIKTAIETWYKENIVDTGYSNYISDNIFCNDRMVSTDPTTDSNGQYKSYNFSTLGYGTNPTLYKAYSRVGYAFSTRNPIFTCPQKNDAFTASNTSKGNGALTYPVGLITADEVTAAGSISWTSSNTKYYLNKGGDYFTMTPWYFHPSHSGTIMYYVSSAGALSFQKVTSKYNFAPVINLKVDYTNLMIGTGTITDPYRAPNL